MGIWDTAKRVGVGVATGGGSEALRAVNGNKGIENGLGGALDPLNPYATAAIPGQPGVGGPAANPALLQQDPTTGLFFDPSTGTSYTDPQGKIPASNPNLAQQTAANFATRTAMLGKIAGQDKTLDQVNAQQGALAGTLNATIHDPNAPSVAGTQLAQQTDANARQILGTAAGVGGANAYDARRNAVSAIAGANTAAAGNAALLRQKEVADATAGLGTLLNQQGGAAQARENTNLNAAADFGKQAGAGQGTQQTLQTGLAEKNKEADVEARGKGLDAISGLATKAFL